MEESGLCAVGSNFWLSVQSYPSRISPNVRVWVRNGLKKVRCLLPLLAISGYWLALGVGTLADDDVS